MPSQGVAAVIDIPWRMVVDIDLAHPDIEGTRRLSCRFSNRYIGLLHRAGRRDAVVTRQFLEVVNLIAPARRLTWGGAAPKTRPNATPSGETRRGRSSVGRARRSQ